MSKIKNRIYFLEKKTRNWYRFFSALFSALTNFNKEYFSNKQFLPTFSVFDLSIFQNASHTCRYVYSSQKIYGKVSLMEKYFLEKLQNVIIYANKTEIINLKSHFWSLSLF